jgi:uncharacterized protein YeeX (DUF496 family)
MRPELRLRADQMVNEIADLMKAGGNVRRKAVKVKMAASDDYVEKLSDWAGEAAGKAFDDVLAELKISRKDAKFTDDLKDLPKKLRDKIIALVLLTAATQETDIEKVVHFAFIGNFEQVDDDITEEEMNAAVDRYFDKKLIETAATNMSSKVTNTARSDVFFAPGVLDDVESFIFTNPAPVSLICQSLNGRVFSKEEYENSVNIPPLHHNCKSYIVAQTTGAAGNKPITPGGLTVTDPKVLRSKTL